MSERSLPTGGVVLDTYVPTALALKAVTKRFDGIAVDSIDLVIPGGEFYALLGPNGAGKTTTLRMVAGLLQPDAGAISIFGVDALADPIAAKRLTTWVPDVPLIYDKLTPGEYLEFIAGLWSVEPARAEAEADRLLRLLDLSQHRDQRCESLSHGTRQKVVLAGALIHEPKLLILDEPLTGLDAVTARQVKDLLHSRVREGASVIMSTHILDVAERTAGRIGIIQSGRIRAEGTLEQLRRQAGLGDSTLEDVFLELTGNFS